MTRRRFLVISAASMAMPAALPASPRQYWSGQALGTRASIRIEHPEAKAITARCLAEIDRLESILSLYQADSALARLNRDGQLAAPPFELLDCLAQARAVHRLSGGLFDVTVQPLWALWAQAATEGRRPTEAERAATVAHVGMDRIALLPDRITLQPGTAITLNGIGQGYVADRIATLLEAEGLSNILIDTGEHRALGTQPNGVPWPMRVQGSDDPIPLASRALATSAPRGTSFDQAGQDGHILDPQTGAPVVSPWDSVSVSAPSAALADAVATAACMSKDRVALGRLVGAFPECQIEASRKT